MHREIDEFSEIHVWSHDTPGAMELSEGFLQKYFETLEQGDTVLDIGCGQGTVVKALQQRGYKVLGVDTNREMIEAALAENLSVRRMSAVAAVEQELLNYNVFSMLDFVEHIPLNVLQDLFRVIATRPGAKLWIQTPNLDSIIGIKFWFQVPSHVTPLNPVVLRKLLRRFNFEIVREWTAYGELPWRGIRRWLSIKILNGLLGAPVAGMFLGGANICLVAQLRPVSSHNKLETEST